MVRLFFQQGFSRALAGLIVYIYPILFGESGLGEYSVYSSYVMVAVIMGFGPMEALAGRASSNNISERDCLLFYALLIVLLLLFLALVLLGGLNLTANYPAVSAHLGVIILAGAAVTGVSKIFYRVLRFQDTELAASYTKLKTITVLGLFWLMWMIRNEFALIVCAIIPQAVATLWYWSSLSFNWSTARRVDLGTHKRLIKELALLYPNRFFGLTVVPLVNIFVAEKYGLQSSGRFFLAMTAVGSISVVLGVFMEAIQKKIYQNIPVRKISEYFNLEWSVVHALLVLFLCVELANASAYLPLLKLEDLWADVVLIGLAASPLILANYLKGIHLAEYFSDSTTSKYFIISTILYFSLVAIGVGLASDIYDIAATFVIARFIANIFAIFLIKKIRAVTNYTHFALILNAIGLLLFGAT